MYSNGTCKLTCFHKNDGNRAVRTYEIMQYTDGIGVAVVPAVRKTNEFPPKTANSSPGKHIIADLNESIPIQGVHLSVSDAAVIYTVKGCKFYRLA